MASDFAPFPTAGPLASIKIAATLADVPEGQTGWIVLAEAILPGYLPPAGRAVALFGDDDGYTQAIVSTTETAPPGTYVEWVAVYFGTPFAIVDPELVSVAVGGNGQTVTTVTDSATARAAALVYVGGGAFTVQLTMATFGAHLADLTAGAVESTTLAGTYGPNL